MLRGRYDCPMALTAEYVLSELSKHADVLRGFGVKKIGLFGSVARGEAAEGSDLDFLVELERHTFDDYFGTKFFLEDHFGCKVDLVMVEALRREFAAQVMQEVVYAQGL
jgi:predicted nucleotidyltransferase